MIMEYLGTPPLEIINKSKRKRHYFDNEGKAIMFTNSKGQSLMTASKKLEKFLDYSNDKLIDLVKVLINNVRNA